MCRLKARLNEGSDSYPRRPATSPSEARSSRIESLRAVAALSVLVGHIAAVSLAIEAIEAPPLAPPVTASTFDELLIGGGLGVFLFFGLTGYLLFWPFVKAGFGEP